MIVPSFLKFDWLINFLKRVGLKDENQSEYDFRTVYLNNAQQRENVKPITKSNSIKTSKYNFINFLPKNLFEQFRRVANAYFLINIIIIFVVPDPPTSPYTSIIPLLFVVVVTAVKQAYEDVLRHISDRKINNRRVRLLRNGEFVEHKWADIRCGDIVEVTADEPFPCDMVLLYSHTDDGVCHITTANLDGETNLKQRSVPRNIPELDTPDKLAQFDAIIECDKPNTHLYEFNGKLIVNQSEYPITNDNILLRGACLRISPLVYGCAIYTGHHTKVMLNSKFKANKLSVIERRLNKFIFFFLGLLAVLTFFCFGLSFIYIDIYSSHWYLKGLEPMYYKENRALYIFIVFVFYMNLLNYIVPLSMYVTVEMQRFVGSQFINWDLELYDEETDQPAEANTSDLNEDLGQVEYLFSDKTGTLTQNVMIFKQFSIDDKIYEERNGRVYQVGSNYPIQLEREPKVMQLLELLSVCHTVQVNENSKEKFQASSPDEFCFVEFCDRLNIEFEGDKKARGLTNKVREVNFQSTKRRYEILQVLEFDSTRKRMSIILKDVNTGRIVMFCKGADSAVLRKCATGNVQGAEMAIKTFAHNGWRTLALSYKELSQAEYDNYERLLLNAYNDFMDRNNQIAAAFEEIESNLNLIGTTAIEDKLQEDVADTLESLRISGIRVWVLTGDKLETAINISQSCKHFSDSMIKFILTGMKDQNQITKNLDNFYRSMEKDRDKSYALVIDGDTLGYVFKYNLEEQFREVCMDCEAVLCCRLSPAQKASIVRLIKQSKLKPITAAIGDGANDVSMIQEAHIGLGIFGKEGNNAAKSSDFCFAKFKFLKRILLVHGYLYYTRASILVQYFFYKNIAFVICQVYFAFWNAFSVTSLYNSIVLTFYNITFTAAPILLYGLFEQRTQIDKITPYLYRTITRNRYLHLFEFLKWNGLGLWHSIVSYFFAYAIFATSVSFKQDGTLSGNVQLGMLIIILIDLIVHLKLFFEWHYQTLITVISYSLSVLGFVVCLLIPSSFIIPYPITEITDDQDLYWVLYDLFSSPQVWFLLIVCLWLAIMPDLVVYAIEKLMDKRARFKLQEKLREQENEAAQNRATPIAHLKPPKYPINDQTADAQVKLRPIANVARKQNMKQQQEIPADSGGVYRNGYTNNGYVPNYNEPPVITTRADPKMAQPDTISLYSVFYRF